MSPHNLPEKTMAGSPGSIWTVKVDTSSGAPTATLLRSVNMGTPLPFVIKGVCYSPCPIGSSNAWGPAIGDWFWDSYDAGGSQTTNWSGTWSADLPRIAALGANTIRVYCMLEQQLSGSNIFTHKEFLDACQAHGLHVLIGIPLPQSLFVSGQTPQPSAEFWTSNLRNTVAQVARHPAVMGFTIANEVDNGALSTYGPPADAEYWWSQVQAMAAIAKSAAPGKLVGICNHDDPGICQNAASYMANCTDIDFWGVNTYQPQSFQSVFGGGGTTGYATLTGAALKPVILTEYGFPSTSRPNALDPAGICSDDATQQKVAAVLNTMLPQAYAQGLNLGVCYFEYCDEWWNQSAYKLAPGLTCPGCTGPDCPNSGGGGSFGPPDTYTWYGGPIACGFPNYYWDNDGFGLYAVGAGQGREPANPWNQSARAPALPLDTRTERTPVTAAVKNAFAAVPNPGTTVPLGQIPVNAPVS
jgi:hypothetical protein